MAHQYEQPAVDVAPPMSGAITGSSGNFCVATTAASQRFDIPSSWKGKYVTFVAVTLDVQISFGGSAVSVTLNQTSGVASEVITTNNATGFPIVAGTTVSYRIPNDASVTDFAIISSGTTGYLFAYMSENRL